MHEILVLPALPVACGQQSRFLAQAQRAAIWAVLGDTRLSWGRAGILHCAQLSLAPPWGSWKWGRCGSAHHIPVPGTGTEARFSSAVHLYKTHGKTAIARGIFITAVTGFEICKINEENPQIARICYHSYGYRSSQQEKNP